MRGAVLKRPRATLLLVGLVVVGALAAAALGRDRLEVAGYTDPGSQSMRASVRLHHALGYDPEPGMVILARSRDGFGSAPSQRAVARLARSAGADPAVGRVQTAFGSGGLRALVSRDARATLLLVHFRSINQDALAGPIVRLRGHLRESGLSLAFGGYALGVVDLNGIARGDLVRAELIAFPLLALLVLLIFRGLVAAAIPVLIGGVSVIGTFVCLRLLSNAVHISIFALNLAVLLGLGLAVDYGLFLVSRYREEAVGRGVGLDAIRATLATAGRAVVFSGCAVGGACAALLLFPQAFIYSMGIAGMLVAFFSAAAALLVTPPLLLLAGGRIGARTARGGARATGHTRWYRWPRWVMRHHVDVALVTVLVLIAAAGPALGLRSTFPDLSSVPTGFQTRTVAEVVRRDFTPNLEYPVDIAFPLGGRDRGALAPARLALLLNLAPGVALAGPIQFASRDTALVQLVLAQPPLSPASETLIARLRALRATVLVGGRTAEFVDLKHSIEQRAPLALLLVAGTTLVVLFLLTGSVVLPAKALLFHALDLGAVFGLLALIFQDNLFGIGGLVAYRGPPAIEITVSVVIIASTFGLATDYSILLLSRITEEHEAGRSDEEAVARGIERTGPIITSSALLLAVALLALASSRVFLVKELTVGQILGVIIDVSFVRLLLVPAFMRILGPLNWWASRQRHRRRAPA